LPGRAFVAVLVIELHFPEPGCLKEKRRELTSIKAQLQTRLGASVSEVDHQDLWQRATLVAALTGGSLAAVEAASDRLERWVLSRVPEGARVERTVASLGDLGL
jgi:uncharacterized protein YlxP (DUF503 family)